MLHFFNITSNLSSISTILTAFFPINTFIYVELVYSEGQITVQEILFNVDLSVHESITHLLKTLGNNRIHSFSNDGFVVKIYFFPPNCNINMSIWHSTVKDRYPESRVPSPIFIDFLRQKNLSWAATPILFLRQNHWSMLEFKYWKILQKMNTGKL